MHIGRVQRRFTAEPLQSPVPGAEVPVEEPVVERELPADAQLPVDARPVPTGADSAP